MSSAVSVLDALRVYNYVSVASTTAVFYDYILTFSREVELIWMKPWSTISTLFVVARYFGLVLASLYGLAGGTGLFYMSASVSSAVVQIVTWTEFVYIVVMHAIMILRVSVMFNRPRRVQYILFALFSLITINGVVILFLMSGPDSGLLITNVPIVNITACSAQFGRSIFIPIYGGIPAGLFDILLMALVVYRFAVHAIETRRRLGKQKINKYMTLLLEHSALYFFLNLTYKGLAIGTLLPSPVGYNAFAILYINTVPFVIYSRLVLSLRSYRSSTGGLRVDSGGSGQRPSHGYSGSSGGVASDSGEYEMSGVSSQKTSRHTRGEDSRSGAEVTPGGLLA